MRRSNYEETICSIWSGQFWGKYALELQKLGCEVVAVDKDMERVKGIADSVSYAMQADIGDPDFVRSLGTRNLDGVVIAEAESLEASIMATLVCKEIGVPNVIAKAKNERHASVLKKIGADSLFSRKKKWESGWQRILCLPASQIGSLYHRIIV